MKVLKLKLRTDPPIGKYLDMRQEYRTSKSVVSRSCDWLLLVLAMRAQGTPLTKTDGTIDEYLGYWGWDKNYPTFIA